jgi:L-ascorbate oxidase
LHSHGLWVSPSGNSDNVLLSINPKVEFEYEYNIPADHPAGTFWYHPHRHGSTAIQVGSGMAGALIIRGDRKPTPAANGDLDTLLVAPDGKPFPDRTLVFQQIPYACLGPDGKLQFDAKGNIVWTCKPGELGVVETYKQLGPSWAESGRWTSINGVVLPTIEGVETAKVERLRLIHGGIQDTISVQFRKTKPGATLATLQAGEANLRTAAVSKLLEDLCTGEIVPYQIVAADGLTMENTLTTQKVTLQPGYRYDLLTVFPEAGLYCMTNPSQPATGSTNGVDTGGKLLGYVNVSGGQNIPLQNVTRVLVDTLAQSAEAHMPPDVRAQIVADLRFVNPVIRS